MEILDDSEEYSNEIEIEIVILFSMPNSGQLFLKIRMKNDYFSFALKDLSYNSGTTYGPFYVKVKMYNKIFNLNFFEIYDRMSINLKKKVFNRFNVFLLFYYGSNRESFTNVQKQFNELKSIFNDNPIYILIRSKYELKFDPNENEENNIVKDEEVLEFAEENNLYYFHLAVFEKYETGIKELVEFIIKEYINRNNKNY